MALVAIMSVTGAPRAARFGWTDFARSLAQVPRLASSCPPLTGFMRYRAAEDEGRSTPEVGPWTPLHEISPYLVSAVVWAEDPGFFRHRGFWWSEVWAQVKQARRNRTGVRGVSTITQQLARNLYLHPGRSMKRKLQEAILAQRIEQVLAKERILEIYLNVIEWGPGFWGVGAAARRYFATTPAELTPLQAVVLASLIPAPRRPLLGGNAERAVRAQRRLAFLLYAAGLLSRDEGEGIEERAGELLRAAAEGVPALDLLDRPVAITEHGRPEITTRGVIADHCGLDRYARMLEFLGRCKKEGREPNFPLWWTGAPEPRAAEPVAG